MLNICSHILADQNPGPPQSKPGLPSLPTAPSLSPIKRKAKGETTQLSQGGNTDHKGSSKSSASSKGRVSCFHVIFSSLTVSVGCWCVCSFTPPSTSCLLARLTLHLILAHCYFICLTSGTFMLGSIDTTPTEQTLAIFTCCTFCKLYIGPAQYDMLNSGLLEREAALVHLLAVLDI